jgi:hypothetical protein
MNPQQISQAATVRHPGPHLGLVATIFVVLFLAGLYAVTIFGGAPYFPGPWESASAITAFFQLRSSAVLLTAFFHFGAAIALGIFTVTAVSQLRFLGARVASTYIALFGGLATALDMIGSASVLWVMTHPGVTQDSGLLRALFYLQYVLGGPGFAVPLGLLMAGISIPSGFMKLLPKWLVVFGLFVAACGELSWFNLVFPQTLFLIPLTRFPGFVWLIATGFLLPQTIVADRSARLEPKMAA